MLREELRQKKRELEAIMKKDNSRKQYGKNQDNQSDTVSYTTDAFGYGITLLTVWHNLPSCYNSLFSKSDDCHKC